MGKHTSIKENENLIFDKNNKPSCFNCSHLCVIGYMFVCDMDKVVFSPVEEPKYDCKDNNRYRDGLKGKAIDLWRILVTIGRPVVMDSLPEQITGAYGMLKKYNLANIKTGSVKCLDKKQVKINPFKTNYLVLTLKEKK